MPTYLGKGGVGAVSGLIFLAGFGFILGNLDFGIFQIGANIWVFLLGLVISAVGCFILGFYNSRSLLQTSLATVAAMVIGLPLAFGIFAPAAELLAQSLIPHVNLSLSASFAGIWLLLTPLILIELITDQVWKNNRLNIFVLGVVAVTSLFLIVEITTADFGQTSRLSARRMMIYAPVSWAIPPLVADLGRKNKTKKEVTNEI